MIPSWSWKGCLFTVRELEQKAKCHLIWPQLGPTQWWLRYFAALHIPLNDPESTVSIDNKFPKTSQLICLPLVKNKRRYQLQSGWPVEGAGDTLPLIISYPKQEDISYWLHQEKTPAIPNRKSDYSSPSRRKENFLLSQPIENATAQPMRSCLHLNYFPPMFIFSLLMTSFSFPTLLTTKVFLLCYPTHPSVCQMRCCPVHESFKKAN